MSARSCYGGFLKRCAMPAGGWRLLLSSSSVSSSSTCRTARTKTATVLWPPLPCPPPAMTDTQKILTVVPDVEPRADAELKLSSQFSGTTLTLHVIEAKNLFSQRTKKCTSFVRVSFYPDCKRKPRKQTEPIPSTDYPLFDCQFTLPVNIEKDADKSLLVSVWNQLDKEGLSEFLGSVTLSVENLIKQNLGNSWHKLENEMVDIRSMVSPGDRPATERSGSSCASSSKSRNTTKSFDVKEVTVMRPQDRGLGFTVSGSYPCHVSKVERRSPADLAGVRAGDYILKVDGAQVFEANNEAVVRLLRHTGSKTVKLELGRSRVQKSPSLPLNTYVATHQSTGSTMTQHRPTSNHNSAAVSAYNNGMKREIKSFHDIAGSVPPPPPPPNCNLHFAHGTHRFVRSVAGLVHAINVALVDKGKFIQVKAFLFIDLLVIASHRPGGSDLINILREPIPNNRITHAYIPRGAPDEVFIQFINSSSRLCLLRFRCSNDFESKEWCTKIKERQMKTFLL